MVHITTRVVQRPMRSWQYQRRLSVGVFVEGLTYAVYVSPHEFAESRGRDREKVSAKGWENIESSSWADAERVAEELRREDFSSILPGNKQKTRNALRYLQRERRVR